MQSLRRPARLAPASRAGAHQRKVLPPCSPRRIAMDAFTRTAQEMVWIEGARRGDIPSFETLLRRYERQIFAFTYRMMGGDAADAEDLTQETFIKAYRALPRTAEG